MEGWEGEEEGEREEREGEREGREGEREEFIIERTSEISLSFCSYFFWGEGKGENVEKERKERKERK